MSDGIVIAGGGLAGQRAAETLRRAGYSGALRMVCAETHLPYDRPPLSKEVLSGERSEQSLRFRPRSWYSDHGVDLLLGVSAVRLCPAEHLLELSDRSTLRYDRLLIATGSRPRELPILRGYSNVSALSTLEDALTLRRALTPGARVTILGAGFVGLEVAAAARTQGAQVTVIEAGPTPLSRVLGPLGEWFSSLHRSEGVDVRCETTLTGASGEDSLSALHFSDGGVLETDHVIVAVGVRPALDWLSGSGLPGAGVPVDAYGQSQFDWIYAAGDAAVTFDPALGRPVPGCHWEAAAAQGACAARTMLGIDPGSPPISRFWTDQYGVRIQYVGHAELADGYVADGDLESREFEVLFTRAGTAVAALLVGRPRALPEVLKLITNGGTRCPTSLKSRKAPARLMAIAR
ncbi:MAG: FAD-dependent oxidoreductase [Actinomycetota bacterium]|nr:FAD-dependent oxidoreductase [Actinomycetota bacterium]